MKTILAKSPHESSFSFSRRYFGWRKKLDDGENQEEEILNFSKSSHFFDGEPEEEPKDAITSIVVKSKRKKPNKAVVSRLKSALTVFNKGLSQSHSVHSNKVIGTLFGYRRGHVHFTVQEDPKLGPSFMIELATPTSILVREMASGTVRIALECDRKGVKRAGKLLNEPLWRTYCNGRKSGYAVRKDFKGEEEIKVLKALEPVTMGAGVLPGICGDGSEMELGELMYMRARFERVVGCKDSEAFYMMNPDGSGGPELSIYLLRV